jgi:hypothetical protein
MTIESTREIPKDEPGRKYNRNHLRRKISPSKIYFVPKSSIKDTVNYSPEEKAKNYQKSFKIWSGVYRLIITKNCF